MGKARPAFSPFSFISLREQSSNRSLIKTERGVSRKSKSSDLIPKQPPLRATEDKSSLTRFRSWSCQVSGSCGHASGPACAPRLPAGSRSTSPHWLYPAPASPRWSYVTQRCDWEAKQKQRNEFKHQIWIQLQFLKLIKTSGDHILHEYAPGETT